MNLICWSEVCESCCLEDDELQKRTIRKENCKIRHKEAEHHELSTCSLSNTENNREHTHRNTSNLHNILTSHATSWLELTRMEGHALRLVCRGTAGSEKLMLTEPSALCTTNSKWLIAHSSDAPSALCSGCVFLCSLVQEKPDHLVSSWIHSDKQACKGLIWY